MKQYLFLLLSLAGLATSAQTAIGLDQQALKQWSIGTANFSGITKIDDTRYAVVSDKEPPQMVMAIVLEIAKASLTGLQVRRSLSVAKGIRKYWNMI